MSKIDVTINKNERSWAIELISQINSIVDNHDLVIKRAGGESTISVGTRKRMFPDVILYKDRQLNTIIQGWELKMPDVPINDEIFVNDAQRKARALGLTSCVIWNFTFARFYVLNNQSDTFEVVKEWENSNIVSRNDVAKYRCDWESTLQNLVITVNDYLVHNNIKTISIGEVISQNAIDILINENKILVANFIKQEAIKNTVISAEIAAWWENVKQEYTFDEDDCYKAYAKNIILNWAYRILFAHLIKRYQKEAYKIENLNYNSTPEEANIIFEEITSKCDFYNIFAPLLLNHLMPSQTWESLVELSDFLKTNGIHTINQTMLQNILECCVNVTRREFHGQFTTPKVLAEILVSITIHDWTDDCYDPCCGTGTIAKEILLKKKDKIGVHKAIATTWASDKYQVPLQIANISLTSSDSINEANRIFQKNVLSLKLGDMVNIVDPVDGKKILHAIPLLGAICSNLPFLSFEAIPTEDKNLVNIFLADCELDRKSDLSYYIALHLSSMLKDGGYLGIIVSNSWLGTKSGTLFYNEIKKKFNLLQVHISGVGRWFQNADVVATIMILQKGKPQTNTNFFVWRKSLYQLEYDAHAKEMLINSSLLNRIIDPQIASMSTYNNTEISQLHDFGLSYNSLFHDVSWILDIQHKLCPLKSLFKVFRGSRRGWDKLFFPENCSDIEEIFLMPALFNAKKVVSLVTQPNRKAFSCSSTLDDLEGNYPGAYRHVIRFINEKNGKGVPLTQVLQRPNEEWYEMRPNEIADLFTMMNPDDRIFFGRFVSPTFINQRLIGLKALKSNIDVELCHALMNSLFMKFIIEAVGFGRGLGVLDINKENISKCFMLNPNMLTPKSINNIKMQFSIICSKPIMTIDEELKDEDWIRYNHIVLEAFKIDMYYDKIVNSLTSLRKVRRTVRKNKSMEIIRTSSKNYTEMTENEHYNIGMVAESSHKN